MAWNAEMVTVELVEDSKKLFAKIEALLRQADSTKYEAEAETFFAKAQELMRRYGIEKAMLASDSRTLREEVVANVLFVAGPHANMRGQIVWVAASCNDCEAIRLNKDSARNGYSFEIVGYKSDVAFVELLVQRVLAHLDRSLASERPSGLTPGESSSYARSFIHAYASGVLQRLREASRAAEHSASATSGASGVALALFAKTEKVQAAFSERHPRIRTTRVEVKKRSSSGARDGKKAAELAPLARGEFKKHGELEA